MVIVGFCRGVVLVGAIAADAFAKDVVAEAGAVGYAEMFGERLVGGEVQFVANGFDEGEIPPGVCGSVGFDYGRAFWWECLREDFEWRLF